LAFLGEKMKTKFNLTSIGLKIVATLLFLALTVLTIVLIIFRSQIPWYVIIISAIIMFIFFGICYIFFFNRIVIDTEKKIVSIRSLKLKKINFDSILRVEVEKSNSINPQKYCFVLFRLKDNEHYKTSGFSSIGKKGVKITEEIVLEINKTLNNC